MNALEHFAAERAALPPAVIVGSGLAYEAAVLVRGHLRGLRARYRSLAEAGQSPATVRRYRFLSTPPLGVDTTKAEEVSSGLYDWFVRQVVEDCTTVQWPSLDDLELVEADVDGIADLAASRVAAYRRVLAERREQRRRAALLTA